MKSRQGRWTDSSPHLSLSRGTEKYKTHRQLGSQLLRVLCHSRFRSRQGAYRRGRKHICPRLVGEFQILINVCGILYFGPDGGSGDDKTSQKHANYVAVRFKVRIKLRGKLTVGTPLGLEGDVVGVKLGRDGAAGGLDTLVEAGEVGEFAAVVGEGAHQPVMC